MSPTTAGNLTSASHRAPAVDTDSVAEPLPATAAEHGERVKPSKRPSCPAAVGNHPASVQSNLWLALLEQVPCCEALALLLIERQPNSKSGSLLAGDQLTRWHMQERHDEGDDLADCRNTEHGLVSKWRQKDKLKTTAVALVLCLNIGVDPPDVIKISPCARLECWVDPLSMQPAKALETIGKREQPVVCHVVLV